MTTTASERDTYYGAKDAAEEVFRMLTTEMFGCYLVGRGVDDQVELDPEIHQVLLRVVDALRQGKAVTVTPRAMTLTTQQAAELLGVSRPTVVKLMDDGRIPFERPGTHRRVRLEDVLDYRESRRRHQHAALDAFGPSEEEPVEVALERLQRVKAEAGRRRRAA